MAVTRIIESTLQNLLDTTHGVIGHPYNIGGNGVIPVMDTDAVLRLLAVLFPIIRSAIRHSIQ